MKVVPVILAGGQGTRLWPASTAQSPKQLLSLTSGLSLLQETVSRARDILQNPDDPIIIVTASDLEQEVSGQLECFLNQRFDFLFEPVSRNTAAAIALAALYADKKFGAGCVLLVLPVDHKIENPRQLIAAIDLGLKHAKDGSLITFGLPPTRPETAYGYIEIDKSDPRPVQPARSFTEKPGLEKARILAASGNYLWNSGIFLLTAGAVLSAYEKAAPDILTSVRESCGDDPHRPALIQYRKTQACSFDRAVLERSDDIRVVPCDFEWEDIGTWSRLWHASDKDNEGNVAVGHEVILHNSQNCLIRAHERKVICVGLDSLIIADTGHALLIAHKDHAADIEKTLSALVKAPL